MTIFLLGFQVLKVDLLQKISKTKKYACMYLIKKPQSLFFTTNLDFVFDFEHEILPVMFL